jgi:uncharacterized protein (DUF433 family)
MGLMIRDRFIDVRWRTSQSATTGDTVGVSVHGAENITTRLGIDAWRAVVTRTPGICGGNVRIRGTRIPVWTVEKCRQLGLSDVQICRRYSSLKNCDLSAVWSYVDLHREEIAQQIRHNDED